MSELTNRRRSISSPDRRVPEPAIPAHIAMIRNSINRLFGFKKSSNFINWFGFFESSTFSFVYQIFISLILLVVLLLFFFNFKIYQDFESISAGFPLFTAGLPFLLLFLPCLIASLTFTLTSRNNKLWCFLLINDQNTPSIEEIDQHKAQFSDEFASSSMNFRVFVCFFASISVVFRVAVDSHRWSHQTSVFVTLLWCYLSIAFVLGNGLVYMSTLSLKIHVSIYKKIVSSVSGHSVQSLEMHHQRLLDLVRKFSRKFSWFLASQILVCCLGSFLTLIRFRFGYVHRPGDFMFGAADPICLVMVVIPVFLTVLFAIKDVTSQVESIKTLVLDKRNMASLLSHPRRASEWISFGEYIVSNNKGVHIFAKKVDLDMVMPFLMQLLMMGFFHYKKTRELRLKIGIEPVSLPIL